MRFPVQATLMYFVKLCKSKNELACFDKIKLKKFLYETEKDYPKVFESMTEDSIEQELFNFSWIVKSIAPEYRSHFISLGSEKHWFNFNKEECKEYEKDLEEIAQKFYDKVGCDLEGQLGKRTRLAG